MLRITGTYSYLNLHGKEKSRKRGWTSHLGIDLGTSPIAGRASPTVPILAPQKQVKTQRIAQWKAYLTEWELWFQKLSDVLWNDQLCLTHKNRPALRNIISYFKWLVISFCHFRNVHTEYVVTRKSPQVHFPKSEKDFSLLRDLLPLATTHTVSWFQIDNWAKSLSSRLISSYLRRNLFHLPKKLYCHVFRSRF